ncbi:MAG: S41 family peptidase [Pseudomonadota bacterium]
MFTYRGDLWRVAATGGTAVPLTTGEAHDYRAVWSPDGQHLAFASNRNGSFDVFVMPATGGAARRLTTHSADERPFTFTADADAVLFGAVIQDAAGNRGYPTRAQPELYSVPVAGGRVTQVLTTPAEAVQVHPDGKTLLYQDNKGYEGEWRKHHTSSIARDVWTYDPASGEHRKLTAFAGEDRNPVPAPDGKTVYYLSEESGTFNVHRVALEGGPSEQLTAFAGQPVRSLSLATNGTLAFSWGGELYTVVSGADPQRVPISIRTDVPRHGREVVAVTGASSRPVLSPDGKELAFVYRGDVFATAVASGMTRQITSSAGRERDVTFSPDGAAIVYAAERDGRWGIYQTTRVRAEESYFFAATLLEEAPLVVGELPSSQPTFAPDGQRLAYIEDRNTLKLLMLDSGVVSTLLTPAHISATRIGGQHFRWSPDGQWILFDQSVPGVMPGEVGLVRADGSDEVINLTRSGFGDSTAQWVLGGAAIIWFSNRDGLKSVAQSGTSQSDVYAMFLTRDAWDRHRLSEDDYALLTELEADDEADTEAAADDTGADDEPAAVVVAPVALDLARAELRVDRLTVHSANLDDALLSDDGETLYYLARFEKGSDLWSTALRSGETVKLAALDAGAAEMLWSEDREHLYVLVQSKADRYNPSAAGKLIKVAVASGDTEDVAIDGEMILDRQAELKQMFEHVWHRTNETFYTAGFHGADWARLKDIYAAYVPHVGNAHEFAELLGELMGELNVSHANVRYRAPSETGDATAALGVFYDQQYLGSGARIVEVIANGPLDQSGLTIEAGTLIEAIDGATITAEQNIDALLNRRAGRRTLVSLRQGAERTDVVVVPIDSGAEADLLYERWVRRNREEVDRLSKGRLGYIHIPSMNDSAYRTVFAEALGRFSDRDGLVVDTRFNGGGDLVADLAMFLSGERFFDYTTDRRSSGYEPNFRWTKPSVAIVGESNYSDGHCFAYAYQHLELGSLVGMPVPGTCTFAGWETLPNGVNWGVPGLGVKTADGVYLENLATNPDLVVENEFAARAAGTDQQLEAAVAELLERLR